MLFVSTLYRAVYALDRYPFFPLFPSDGKETSEMFSFFPFFPFKKREREREDGGG